MGKYRMNDQGEWVRVDLPPPEEPKPSMAEYIRKAHKNYDEDLEEAKRKWMMEGPINYRSKAGSVEYGPRGGRFTRSSKGYKRYF